MRVDRPFLLVTAFAYLFAGNVALAQEHPEHPKKQEHPAGEKKEHPEKQEHPTDEKKEHPKKAEHPKSEEAKKAFTTADLETEIKTQIAAKTKTGMGFFRIKDPVTKKTWRLKLDRVHSDKLTQLDPDTYFACVDFNSSDGKKVDVDFFLEQKNGKLVMTDTTIHKVNGKPRYTWEEHEGFWKRAPIKP